MSFFSDDKSRLISIDIGFRNIKIAEVAISKENKLKLLNYGIIPTPRECIKNGHIRDMSKMIISIKRVILENGITTKKAKIVMSGTHIATRLVMVSLPPETDITQYIQEMVVQHFPAIKLETHEIDFQVIQKESSGAMTNYKVFVVATLKSMIKSYIDILLELALVPIAVEIPAFSVARFFKQKIQSENKNAPDVLQLDDANDTFSVIDFGSETTIVNVLRNKQLEFNKVLLRGSSNIDEAIAKEIFRKLSEAEAIKQKYGFFIPKTFHEKEIQGLTNAITSVIDEIIVQILKCFEFYYQKCGGSKINRVYIIGGGSNLQGLKEYMMKRINIPIIKVELINIDNITIDKKLDINKVNYLINALGIALE